MRAIKFRVWNKSKKIMLNEKQGQIVIRLNGKLKDSFTGNGSVLNLPERNPKWPIMQFTGLLDKNGKEIYEGDIVSWGKKYTDRSMIGWDNFYNSFCLEFLPRLKQNKIEKEPLCSDLRKSIEIIGNIFENPELLK